MSIDNITGKILSEAEEQGKRILDDARSKSRKIIEEAEQKAEKILNESAEKIGEDKRLVKTRRISVAELEVRKIRLGAKQAQIALCFDEALDRLSKMDEADYLELLTASLIRIGGQGGQVLLNQDDHGRIGERLISKVNDTGKVGTLSLAEDTIDARGGFILRRGSVEINSTLETMISGIRESTIPHVVKALYG